MLYQATMTPTGAQCTNKLYKGVADRQTGKSKRQAVGQADRPAKQTARQSDRPTNRQAEMEFEFEIEIEMEVEIVL